MDDRTLTPGSTGDDVAELHRALQAIGIEIAEVELEERRFGDSTLAAVTRLQTLMGMAATGEVDRATLNLARAARERLAA
jgi:murein L,D-transpeptidase YcbB/YkuD